MPCLGSGICRFQSIPAPRVFVLQAVCARGRPTLNPKPNPRILCGLCGVQPRGGPLAQRLGAARSHSHAPRLTASLRQRAPLAVDQSQNLRWSLRRAANWRPLGLQARCARGCPSALPTLGMPCDPNGGQSLDRAGAYRLGAREGTLQWPRLRSRRGLGGVRPRLRHMACRLGAPESTHRDCHGWRTVAVLAAGGRLGFLPLAGSAH